MPAEELPHADPEEGPGHEAPLAANGAPRAPVPGLTAPLSHVLPTVGDDHHLLGLPVLAALGLCRPNRREKSGQGGWRVGGYAPSTPQSSSSRHGLCLQVPGLLIPLSHRAVRQGPWWSPTCLCTPRSALQSGRLRLWDPQSLGCLVFHSTDSH